jgi:hypothetical protein
MWNALRNKVGDEQIAREFSCRADLIAAQRQRIVEKLEIDRKNSSRRRPASLPVGAET